MATGKNLPGETATELVECGLLEEGRLAENCGKIFRGHLYFRI